MRPSLARGIIAVALAIGVTTAMDATGLTAFSALPLCPLALILWSIERAPRRDVGLTLGRPRYYWVAIIYPVVIIGACAIAALAMGAANLVGFSGSKTARDMIVVAAATIVIAVLTEEGFFRGALWASLTRGGLSTTSVLALTSIGFALWHISAITLATGFDRRGRFQYFSSTRQSWERSGGCCANSPVRSWYPASRTASGMVWPTRSSLTERRLGLSAFIAPPSSVPRSVCSDWR